MEKEKCLVAVTRDATLVPIWPTGTTPVRAADGRRGVSVPGKGEILDGDAFRQGGSWIAGTEIAKGCGDHDEFFAVDGFEP
ncbi:hypothetical protein FDA94_27765 [Herbidospora galbida]|uniref:Uncharacterized protein n=1 Tax=Herbidospora galbida TaxID=2575442 RepID=A0A4V5UYU9_9ACTN|nr:hypothetical protein [Herbidospora galbida]TKK84983.1 hypothetical protein FDA94_27765 [Herbidospora galbida]